jgi:DNA-binding response OmpR family regulator
MYNAAIPAPIGLNPLLLRNEDRRRAMSKVEKPIVLLVDDNEATCTLVSAILQRHYSIEIATEGKEALENIKRRNYAVVLLDLRMPGLDGFGVLESMRSNSPDLLRRVLILTAALTAKDIDRVKAFNICGVIGKPFEVETLLAAVRHCIDPVETAPLMKPFLSNGVLLVLAGLLPQVSR